MRLLVKKVKSVSFTLFVGYFASASMQDPGVVGIDVKRQLLSPAKRGGIRLRDSIDHFLQRLHVPGVAFPRGILHSARA